MKRNVRNFHNLDASQAMTVFNALLPSDELDQAVVQIRRLYPEILVARDDTVQLWVKGKAWLATPDPKDLAIGLDIFRSIAALNPRDYWASMLHGACMFWSGRPHEAIKELLRARDVDPKFPHAYAIGAKCFVALGCPEDAVQLVKQMLDTELTLKEKDHYNKVLEALEVGRRKLSRFRFN